MTCDSKCVFRATFIATLIIAVSSCGDYRVDLPNGYQLVRVYGGAFTISHPVKGGVVHSNVGRYAVVGDLVVGYVTTPDHVSLEERRMSIPGFFILNTATNSIKVGLDEERWAAELKANGVSHRPNLRKPSRFDDWRAE